MRAALLAACGALVLTGCSSAGAPTAPPTAPAPAPTGTGYFVGTGPDGLGVSLDLLGADPAVRVIDAALRAQDGRPGSVASVGVASVVNQGPLAVAAPRFVAEMDDGSALALRAAATVLARHRGPMARRALARLRAVPMRVPAGGAVTTYVVLEGGEPAAVARVRMTVVAGEPITLSARRR